MNLRKPDPAMATAIARTIPIGNKARLADSPDTEAVSPIRSYTKAQLADAYNVAPRTFTRWLYDWEPQLKKFKYCRRCRVLTPAMVKCLFADKALGPPSYPKRLTDVLHIGD